MKGKTFLQKSKRGDANMAPHPCKTPYAAQVAPQRCPILHTGKSKIILQPLRVSVNRLRRLKTLPFVAVYIPACGGLVIP